MSSVVEARGFPSSWSCTDTAYSIRTVWEHSSVRLWRKSPLFYCPLLCMGSGLELRINILYKRPTARRGRGQNKKQGAEPRNCTRGSPVSYCTFFREKKVVGNNVLGKEISLLSMNSFSQHDPGPSSGWTGWLAKWLWTTPWRRRA